MISKYKVIPKLDNSFNVVWITFFQKKKEFCFDCCLVVIFLLVFDKLDSNEFFMLMIHAFNDLAKGTFTYDFDKLISIGNMVIFLNPIVSFLIIKSIINKSFKFCRLNFLLVITYIINFLIFFYLCLLKISKIYF